MKFREEGDEAWDSIGTGSFFMQLIEAARETVPCNYCSNYTLSYSTEKQYLISLHQFKIYGFGIPIASTRLLTRL
jgi:hypothetical protein